MPGFYFALKEQYIAAHNRKWLLTHVRHIGKQSPALEELSSTGEATYDNTFSVLPKDLAWGPTTPDPKP